LSITALEQEKEELKMEEGKYRVLRIIEYSGTREWVDKQIANRSVKGTRVVVNGGTLREAIIGDVPELLGHSENFEGRHEDENVR
jgi:hypothetical protein